MGITRNKRFLMVLCAVLTCFALKLEDAEVECNESLTEYAYTHEKDQQATGMQSKASSDKYQVMMLPYWFY